MSESKFYTAAIVGALPVEIAYLSKYLAEQPDWKSVSENEYVNEPLKIRLVVWVIGAGKVNAAFGTADLISAFKPDIIINVGIAGGFVKGARRGDVAIGKSYAQVDHKPYFKDHLPVLNDAPAELVRNAILAASELGISATSGVIATGDFFLHDSKQKEAIAAEFNPVAFDMESAAICQVASAKGIGFMSIRTFSDFADDDAGNIATTTHNEIIQKTVTIEHTPVIIAVEAIKKTRAA